MFNNDKDLTKLFNALFGGALGDLKKFTSSPLLGETTTEEGEDENGKWTKTTFTSKDGSYTQTSYIKTGGFSKTKQKTIPNKLSELKSLLEQHIKNEDFEKCVEIRDQIKEFETKDTKISDLRSQLEELILDQNFEEATLIRDQIKKLEK